MVFFKKKQDELELLEQKSDRPLKGLSISKSHLNQAKTFLFIGAVDKTDILLNFANALTQLDERVLLIDSTKRQLYKKGYTQLSQPLYDFQGVDIVTGHYTLETVKQLLKEKNERLSAYDVILIDVDDEQHLHDWGEHIPIYFGSEERLWIHEDRELLNAYVNSGEDKMYCIQQMIQSTLSEKQLDELLNAQLQTPIYWLNEPFLFEKEEVDLIARTEMQYDLTFHVKRLSNTYKNSLALLISMLFGNNKKEVLSALKR